MEDETRNMAADPVVFERFRKAMQSKWDYPKGGPQPLGVIGMGEPTIQVKPRSHFPKANYNHLLALKWVGMNDFNEKENVMEKDYQIVTSRDHMELESLVYEQLKEGWSVAGGLCVAKTDVHSPGDKLEVTYFQAMKKG